MPDPSEPSRPRPERVTPAPGELRRRVLARVRSEPQPLGGGPVHAARRLLGGRGRALAGLAAAAVIAAGAGIAVSEGGSPATLPSASVARELAGARADLRRVAGHAELLLAGMPIAPVGEVYEVWLSGHGSAPRPTDALFNVTSAGTAAVEIPGSLQGVARITVTAEPLGGSAHPSSPVILSVSLPASRDG